VQPDDSIGELLGRQQFQTEVSMAWRDQRNTRTIELIAVKNLVKHDRASGHLNVAYAGAFPVLLVGDDDAVLIDALVRLDPVLECILPNVREPGELQ
jgi:hypothetical protein